MMTMNTDAVSSLMDALHHLLTVPGTELEQRSIKAKIKALQNPCLDGLEGKQLIDAMGDETLALEILDRRFSPPLWRHIETTRPRALNLYAQMHINRGGIISSMARSTRLG